MHVSSQHILSLVGEWVLSISRKVIAKSANIENDRIFETVQWMEFYEVDLHICNISLYLLIHHTEFQFVLANRSAVVTWKQKRLTTG